MPIFRDRKIIYIHITKTAGSSIEAALGLNVNYVEDYYNRQYLTHHFRHGGSKLEEVQHYTLQQYISKGLISDNLANECFKFAFVRNPYDRCLSEWLYQMKMNKEKGWFAYRTTVLLKNSFDAFVKHLYDLYKKGKLNNRAHDRCQHLYIYNDGKQVVDYVGRFENIDEDWRIIREKIGLNCDLPHYNNGKKKAHYSQYYSESNRKLVEEIYSDDLKLFGYQF